MTVKLDLEYDTLGEIMLTMLYDGYDTHYLGYRDDRIKWEKLGKPDSWVRGLRQSEEEVKAFHCLIMYYGGLESEVNRIRERIDYGDKIIRGMSKR